MHFKNLKEKPKRESPKRAIYASGGLGPLHMVSEADTGRCASNEAKPQRGVDTRRCASKDASRRIFKTLRRSPKGKAQRG